MLQIQAIYLKTFFRNNKNGYTLFLCHSDLYGSFKCCGIIPKYTEKTPLLLTGCFEINNEQEIFIVESISFFYNNRKLLLEYISHNLCPGIGSATAEKILQITGNDIETFSEKENASYLLSEIKGIDENKANLILSKLRSNKICKDLYEILYSYGCSYKQAETIFKKYYNDSFKILNENPYKCIKECNIDFGIIDAYAHNHNILYYNSERINAIISMAYKMIASTGSTYATYSDMIKFIRQIENNKSAYEEFIPESLCIFSLFNSTDGKIEQVDNEIRFYSKYYYYSENKIVEKLNIITKESKIIIDQNILDKHIKENKILDDNQKPCLNILNKTGFYILTGGPGTGKTTTIKEIVTTFNKECPNKKVALCAPTGRAAERISETSGMLASTIHMLLEYQNLYGEESGPTRNAYNPLEVDLLIIDEFSMVDTDLFEKLLDALPDEIIIIAVGDENQLKSVRPGKILSDLIESDIFNVYRLTKIHRQAEGSTIIKNSQKIQNCQTDLITDDTFKIFRFQNNAEVIAEYQELMKKHYDPNNPNKLQAIGILKNNLCGINNMNRIAQSLFSTGNPYFYYGDNVFYLHDKIMTTKNNYDEGYMNGDIGILKDFNPNEAYMKINDKIFEISNDNWDDISLSYAITTHKSQGSESENIILLIPNDISINFLENALVYVGVTRAKKRIWILTVEDSLEKAIRNKGKSKRKTGLCEKLKRKWGKN